MTILVYHGNQPVDGWNERHLQYNQYSYLVFTKSVDSNFRAF